VVGLIGAVGLGLELLLDGNFTLGAEDILGEEAEDAGFFEGDAVFGEEVEDLGEGAVDVFGRGEGAGSFGEFGSDNGIGFGLGLMREAVRCAGESEHAAAMAASRGESATRGNGGVGLRFHFGTPGGCTPVFCGVISKERSCRRALCSDVKRRELAK
jgi:hypothetical protein